MDLWILSQDKEHLVKATDIDIKFEDKKVITVNCFDFGTYETPERAKEILLDIEKRIMLLSLFSIGKDPLKEQVIRQIRDEQLITYIMPEN